MLSRLDSRVVRIFWMSHTIDRLLPLPLSQQMWVVVLSSQKGLEGCLTLPLSLEGTFQYCPCLSWDSISTLQETCCACNSLCGLHGPFWCPASFSTCLLSLPDHHIHFCQLLLKAALYWVSFTAKQFCRMGLLKYFHFIWKTKRSTLWLTPQMPSITSTTVNTWHRTWMIDCEINLETDNQNFSIPSP